MALLLFVSPFVRKASSREWDTNASASFSSGILYSWLKPYSVASFLAVLTSKLLRAPEVFAFIRDGSTTDNSSASDVLLSSPAVSPTPIST